MFIEDRGICNICSVQKLEVDNELTRLLVGLFREAIRVVSQAMPACMHPATAINGYNSAPVWPCRLALQLHFGVLNPFAPSL